MQQAPWQQFRLPNLVTYLSLAMTFVGYFLALRHESIHWLGFTLGLSSILDIFDGKFASLFQRTKFDAEFGMQIDSLVDATVFGAIPALLIVTYFAVPRSEPLDVVSLMLIAGAFFYLLCALARLGFYNVHNNADSAESHKEFIGLPTTLTTVFWAPLLLWAPSPHAAAGMFFFLGLFMILPLRIRRPKAIGLAIVCLMILIFSILNLNEALQAISYE